MEDVSGFIAKNKNASKGNAPPTRNAGTAKVIPNYQPQDLYDKQPLLYYSNPELNEGDRLGYVGDTILGHNEGEYTKLVKRI